MWRCVFYVFSWIKSKWTRIDPETVPQWRSQVNKTWLVSNVSSFLLQTDRRRTCFKECMFGSCWFCWSWWQQLPVSIRYRRTSWLSGPSSSSSVRAETVGSFIHHCVKIRIRTASCSVQWNWTGPVNKPLPAVRFWEETRPWTRLLTQRPMMHRD